MDKWVKTNDRDTFQMARRLIKEEGLLCGKSWGKLPFHRVVRTLQERRAICNLCPIGYPLLTSIILVRDKMQEKLCLN